MLWSSGYYDGVYSGVGDMNGVKVWVDASGRRMGGYQVKEKWAKMFELMDELLDDSHSDRLYDEIEERYEKQMHEITERTFHVFVISDDIFEKMLANHQAWERYIGAHTSFTYDSDGLPKRHMGKVWRSGPDDYMKAHYSIRPHNDIPPLTTGEPIGYITYKNLLRTKTSFRGPEYKDPRSQEMIDYQANWKSGDPVRTDL